MGHYGSLWLIPLFSIAIFFTLRSATVKESKEFLRYLWVLKLAEFRVMKVETTLPHYYSAWQWSVFELRCLSVMETFTLPIGRMIVKLGGSLIQMVM